MPANSRWDLIRRLRVKKCEANRENQAFLQLTIQWLIFQHLHIDLHLNYERQKYMKNKIHQEQTTKNCKLRYKRKLNTYPENDVTDTKTVYIQGEHKVFP